MTNCPNSFARHGGCASPCGMHNGCGWCSSCASLMNGCANSQQTSCPYSQWMQPISCAQAYYTCAGAANGATLVIHQIVLEAGGEQSCTPRSFQLRITGPSYPCGEIFTLRAGSCTELDEPLVISGLEPGRYRIEPLFSCTGEFISTITGPGCGEVITVSASAAPTVVTIVSRRILSRCQRRLACAIR